MAPILPCKGLGTAGRTVICQLALHLDVSDMPTDLVEQPSNCGIVDIAVGRDRGGGNESGDEPLHDDGKSCRQFQTPLRESTNPRDAAASYIPWRLSPEYALGTCPGNDAAMTQDPAAATKTDAI